MDRAPQYQSSPARMVFQFAAGGELHTGWVSLDALSAIAGHQITTEEQATVAYLHRWRHVHAAALGLRAQGMLVPFVQRADVT